MADIEQRFGNGADLVYRSCRLLVSFEWGRTALAHREVDKEET